MTNTRLKMRLICFFRRVNNSTYNQSIHFKLQEMKKSQQKQHQEVMKKIQQIGNKTDELTIITLVTMVILSLKH